jgi:hypothetical protein
LLEEPIKNPNQEAGLWAKDQSKSSRIQVTFTYTIILATVFCRIFKRYMWFVETNSQEEWWQTGIWLSTKKLYGFIEGLQVWQGATRLELDFHWTY